jgi:hypothetical protein
VTQLPVLGAAVYGSCFGAGLGVLLLAVLEIFITVCAWGIGTAAVPLLRQ